MILASPEDERAIAFLELVKARVARDGKIGLSIFAVGVGVVVATAVIVYAYWKRAPPQMSQLRNFRKY